MTTNVLLIFAFVLFVIAAPFRGPAAPEAPWYNRIGFHFGWAGMACWIASIIFK